MITVNVRIQTNRIASAFAALSGRQIDKATSVAINKTLLKGRTAARTAVKRVYNIPQRNLQGVNIRYSKPSFLQGNIHATSRPIPMDAFSPKFDIASGGRVLGTQSISKRGVLSTRIAKNKKQRLGVSIEVKKGDRTVVPFAFMLPGMKPRIFARGEYEKGNGSFGFIKRHTREENSQGHDAVKPLVSVTVFGAVVNPTVNRELVRVVNADYDRNLMTALRHQLSKMPSGV